MVKLSQIMSKEENIRILLKNFVESREDIEIVYVYSNQGLLISKYGRLDKKSRDITENDDVYGALTAHIEKLLDKISLEYKTGHFGGGSFETLEHRIIYLEAGSEAILLLVCNYEITLNNLFPVAYVICEKVAKLLEGSFDFKYNSLGIPDLSIHEEDSLELNSYPINESDQIIEDATTKNQLKRSKKVQNQFILIMLGSAAVGKTTLVNQFLKKEQTINYRPTLGLSISTQQYHILGFEDVIIEFLLYDLAGQEFFKRFRTYYCIRANCIFIVYDVTKRDTFDDAINFWFKDARKELGNIPIVLIGNKIDLDDKRVVLKAEGLKKAEELRCSFIEISALQNINVQDTFKIAGIGLLFKVL